MWTDFNVYFCYEHNGLPPSFSYEEIYIEQLSGIERGVYFDASLSLCEFWFTMPEYFVVISVKGYYKRKGTTCV